MKFNFLSALVIANLIPAFLRAQEINPEWKVGLESAFYLQLSHLPTSKQGQAAFDFSELKIDPSVKLNDQLSASFRFSLADERSTRMNNYFSEVENAYIQYQSARAPNWIHELGLVRPYWHRYEGALDQIDIFGLPSKSLSRRYRFMSLGDLGYQGRYNISEDAFAVFGIVNGEENSEGENGPSKEGFLAFFKQNQDYLFGIWVSHGRVDTVDSKIADRNRTHLRYQLRLGRFAFGLEGLWAQDSNADYENELRGEGMTFAELTKPQVITTYAGRLETYYHLSERQQVVVRYDLLRPDLKNKDVESWTAAWLSQEESYLSWGVFYENTQFGAEHSAQSRQRESLRLGLNLKF